jgi:hypothetical protein
VAVGEGGCLRIAWRGAVMLSLTRIPSVKPLEIVLR